MSLNDAWYHSRYTGLFRQFGPVPLEAYDPDIAICSGLAPLPGDQPEAPASGGAGWEASQAEAAAIGEAIERWQAWPLPGDGSVRARSEAWPVNEPFIAPERCVLFHQEQYALPGFPYQPLTPTTECTWVRMREAGSGLPYWVPQDLVYLRLPKDQSAQLCPLISSGLSCARDPQQALLRGLQEVIERDATVGAAWGRYTLQESPEREILNLLGPEIAERIRRANLQYRYFRVRTPYSRCVTIVSVTGEDRVGFCYSVGASCRETLRESWGKSLLEAIQGRHYVRYLKRQYRETRQTIGYPQSFAEHAVYYSLYPKQLNDGILGRIETTPAWDKDPPREGIRELQAGLPGPVLFRNLTPIGFLSDGCDWWVLRVVVPGLQPLHGHHLLPFLGGPMWQPRTWADWQSMPPHPYA